MSKDKKTRVNESHPMTPAKGPEYPPDAGSPMARHFPPSESGSGVAAPYVPEDRRKITEPLPKDELDKFKESHEASTNEPTPQASEQLNPPQHAIENSGVSEDRTLYKIKKKPADTVQVTDDGG